MFSQLLFLLPFIQGRAADLGSIEAVSRQIVASGNSSAIVVVQSTVPIGATDLINSIFTANQRVSYQFEKSVQFSCPLSTFSCADLEKAVRTFHWHK